MLRGVRAGTSRWCAQKIIFCALTAFSVAPFECPMARAAEFSGVPRVVDGDTLAIGAVKVRLDGIDAPETDQICLDAKAARWTCGLEARDRLQSRIAGRAVACVSSGTDAYQRQLAACSVAGENLNEWAVKEGWALAYVKYSTAYVKAENAARESKRGLWRGAFIAPWDWRHRNNKTVILGAVSVPVSAQQILLAPSGREQAPSAKCVIKGNVNRNGERIYHTPDQKYYAAIDMSKGGGRRWFCTPEEAEAAGWRRALR
jgi:endonuclease YncB( thermonuclease family)